MWQDECDPDELCMARQRGGAWPCGEEHGHGHAGVWCKWQGNDSVRAKVGKFLVMMECRWPGRA